MKKMIVMVALGAMMLVSCFKGFSEEGQKAWEKFKDLGAKFESIEIADANFETAEEFEAAYAEFEKASEEMTSYLFEFTPAQADTFNTMREASAATYQQYVEMATAAVDEEAEGEEVEVEAEETEE